MTAEVEDLQCKISSAKQQASRERFSTWQGSPYKRITKDLGRRQEEEEDGGVSGREYADQSPQVTYVEHTLTRTVEYETFEMGTSANSTNRGVPWYRKSRMARSPVTRESFRTGLELLSESQDKDSSV